MAEGKNKNKSFKQVMKSSWGGIIVIFLFFTVYLFVNPGNNVFTWIAAKIEIHSQHRQMRQYQREIMQMDSRIRELTSDRDTLETFARE